MKKFMKSIFMVLGFAFVLSFASCSNGSSSGDDTASENIIGDVLYSGTISGNNITTLISETELDNYSEGYVILTQEHVSGTAKPGYYIDDTWVASVWNEDTENSRIFFVTDLKGHKLQYNPYDNTSYKVTVIYTESLN
ncbi:MAG: hypothetical protein K6C98_04035 [Treponema sp.]|nr:hypothetical protein [Treponema sp.]